MIHNPRFDARGHRTWIASADEPYSPQGTAVRGGLLISFPTPRTAGTRRAGHADHAPKASGARVGAVLTDGQARPGAEPSCGAGDGAGAGDGSFVVGFLHALAFLTILAVAFAAAVMA